jgi:hypothetical protein
MCKAPLMWLDNLPVECITSWTTLSRLFTNNYQATYNRPGKHSPPCQSTDET